MRKLTNKRSFRNFCFFALLTFAGILVAPVPILGGDLPAGPDVKDTIQTRNENEKTHK